MSKALAARLGIKLERQLSWRKKELITVYMDIPDGVVSPLVRMKCRQAIVLLYAHWEGFAKSSFNYYLQAIAKSNLNPRLLRPELFGLCLQSRIRDAAERRVAHEIGRQLKSIVDPNTVLPGIPIAGIIRTRSNLNGEVLREILETVGLEPTRYASFEADPIGVLLRSRNSIAHGDGMPIPLESYRRLHHSILDLMDDIRNHLEDQLAASSYRD